MANSTAIGLGKMIGVYSEGPRKAVHEANFVDYLLSDAYDPTGRAEDYIRYNYVDEAKERLQALITPKNLQVLNWQILRDEELNPRTLFALENYLAAAQKIARRNPIEKITHVSIVLALLLLMIMMVMALKISMFAPILLAIPAACVFIAISIAIFIARENDRDITLAERNVRNAPTVEDIAIEAMEELLEERRQHPRPAPLPQDEKRPAESKHPHTDEEQAARASRSLLPPTHPSGSSSLYGRTSIEMSNISGPIKHPGGSTASLPLGKNELTSKMDTGEHAPDNPEPDPDSNSTEAAKLDSSSPVDSGKSIL